MNPRKFNPSKNLKHFSDNTNPLDYSELEDFISSKMQMAHIYQPVMIKTLLESGGNATVDAIARAFLARDQSQIDYYKYITNVMPGKVLRKHKLVIYKNGTYTLDVQSLTDQQKNHLIKLCNQKLDEYEQRHGKKIWKHRARDAKPISGTIRYDVISRAKGRCEACGISSDERALDVDHIMPRNKGGETEIGNLQALCYKCNSEKRDRDNTAFRDWKEEKFAQRNKSCPFCKQEKSASESNALAFSITDSYPVTKDHTLICPRRHIKSFFEMIPAEKNHCFELVERIKTILIERDKTITGFNIGFNDGADAGQTVFHCHIHVIPRRKGDAPDPTGGIRNVIAGKGKYIK